MDLMRVLRLLLLCGQELGGELASLLGAGLDCLGFRAPLRLGESDGCNYGFVPYSGTVVLLPRGGCSFVRKAMHMQVAIHVIVGWVLWGT